MTILLAVVLVAALGTWIPLAQLLPGTPRRSRVLLVAVGNVVSPGIALLASGADLVFGWRGFWLPLAGGVVWTAGNYCVFKASETIGLARPGHGRRSTSLSRSSGALCCSVSLTASPKRGLLS